jgi:hypothetical protein
MHTSTGMPLTLALVAIDLEAWAAAEVLNSGVIALPAMRESTLLRAMSNYLLYVCRFAQPKLNKILLDDSLEPRSA